MNRLHRRSVLAFGPSTLGPAAFGLVAFGLAAFGLAAFSLAACGPAAVGPAILGRTVSRPSASGPAAASPPEGKRILVYTRNGPGYVHDNIAASVEALRRIAARHGVGVAVSDTPSVFTEENLSRYAAVVFSNSNNDAFANDAQRLAFMRYVRAGGGFMGVHSACASERGWPWFWALVGGRFVRHPAHQPFDIRVVDPKHPASDFLPPVWKWRDECYYLNHLNPDIHVLLAADLRNLEDPERAVYPGVTFGDLFPLAWTHEFEGSRQFYTALGHDIAHYSDPLFERHLEQGLVWVLGSGLGLDWGRAGNPAVESAAPGDPR